MRHKPMIYDSRDLFDEAFLASDNSEVFGFIGAENVSDNNWKFNEESESDFYVITWPNHTTTRKVNCDCCAHGPYTSIQKAKKDFLNVEMFREY